MNVRPVQMVCPIKIWSVVRRLAPELCSIARKSIKNEYVGIDPHANEVRITFFSRFWILFSTKRWFYLYSHKIVCANCGNNTCSPKGNCCNEKCVGCSDTDPSQCLSCRYFSIGYGEDQKCVEKCPASTYALEGRRCVTREACLNTTRPYFLMYETPLPSRPYIPRKDGECTYVCPSDHYPDGKSGQRECKECGAEGCKRECPAGSIDTISAAQRYRGCTHIKGSFVINIKNQGGRKYHIFVNGGEHIWI